jgi:hypothetical protein
MQQTESEPAPQHLVTVQPERGVLTYTPSEMPGVRVDLEFRISGTVGNLKAPEAAAGVAEQLQALYEALRERFDD